MGGAQAASVLRIVAEDRAALTGQPLSDEQEATLAVQSERIIESMEHDSEAMFCSSRLMDDGLIDPADTRNVVLFALETCLEAPWEKVPWKTGCLLSGRRSPTDAVASLRRSLSLAPPAHEQSTPAAGRRNLRPRLQAAA